MASQYFPNEAGGPPVHGSVGRGGTDYRGKKNRGGYSNGNGRGRANFNDISNWRTPSYASQNFDPRAAPNALPHGHPANWGLGSGYPAPHGNHGGFAAPAMSVHGTAASTNYQPTSPFSGQISFAAPPTPIVTRTDTITMPSPESPRFTPSRVPATKAASDAGDAPRALAEDSTLARDADEDGQRTNPQYFTPVPASAPQQPGKPPLSWQRPVLKTLFKGEGSTYPIDELHQKTQDRFEAICTAPLIDLLNIEPTLAKNLVISLDMAREEHQVHETACQKQRSSLLTKLLAAREAEARCDSKVLSNYNKAASKMTEAFELVGDAKDAAQMEAIRHLQAATEQTNLATMARRKIDQNREYLLQLDNVRVISANTYAEKVQSAVTKILNDLGMSKTGATSTGFNKAANAQPQANIITPDASHDQASLPTTAQQIFSQSIIERRPETGHQSIEEVLGPMEEQTDVRVGLGPPTDKQMDEAPKVELPLPPNENATFKSRIDSAAAIEAQVAVQATQNPTPDPPHVHAAPNAVATQPSPAPAHLPTAPPATYSLEEWMGPGDAIKQDLEARLKASGPESVLNERAKQTYWTWVVWVHAAEFVDPLVATAMQVLKDEVVGLLERVEKREEGGSGDEVEKEVEKMNGVKALEKDGKVEKKDKNNGVKVEVKALEKDKAEKTNAVKATVKPLDKDDTDTDKPARPASDKNWKKMLNKQKKKNAGGAAAADTGNANGIPKAAATTAEARKGG